MTCRSHSISAIKIVIIPQNITSCTNNFTTYNDAASIHLKGQALCPSQRQAILYKKGLHQIGLPNNKMRMIYSQKVMVCVSQSISLMVAIDSTW